MVPGLSDDRVTLECIAGFIAAELGPMTPWHQSRFFPTRGMAQAPPTGVERLEEALVIGARSGLAHCYSPALAAVRPLDTRCPGCKRALIARARDGTVYNRLSAGRCPGCGRWLNGIGLA